MSEDMDGYLLKCVLEKLEEQERAEGLEELCACSLGLIINKGE